MSLLKQVERLFTGAQYDGFGYGGRYDQSRQPTSARQWEHSPGEKPTASGFQNTSGRSRICTTRS